VETEAQADVLRRLGCQYAQHVGRPMPAVDLHAHLTGAADTGGAVAPVR
jgi:EAL domain-containing protein (putative c-di-GMP-specific phosphodiesterase class I)